MKTLFATLLFTSALSAAGLGLYLIQPDDPSAYYSPLPGYQSPTKTAQPSPAKPAQVMPPQAPAPAPHIAAAAPSAPAAPDFSAPGAFTQAMVTLTSPHTGYGQKQLLLEQLSKAGKLDDAIAELQRFAAGNPKAAEYPAALGLACLKKCTTLQDMREQGLLGLQADKEFDTALNLDPANWDARFTKAVAMSYWPEQLNKRQEVLESFTALIQQQEKQAPQPEYAESYLWLGDEYKKAGRSEDATQVWARGAALFPGHAKLQARLAGGQ